MRRLLVAVLAVAVISPFAVAPARADLGGTAISWTVNHRAKTITVKANVQLFFGPCRSEIRTSGGGVIPTGRDCSATQADIAAEMKKDIEDVWNRGYRYRCYLLIFVVNIQIVRSRFDVDKDKIGVRVDRGIAGLRSHVAGNGPTDDHWSSNDPADRWDPENHLLDGTEFGYPRLNPHSYAHEFGHILGLDDTYVEGKWTPKPGAPTDLMTYSALDFLDQSTINRVVERNRDRLKDTKGNAVDLDDLVCDLMFRLRLVAEENYYGAVHLQDSLLGPPCSPAPTSASTDQYLDVESAKVDVIVVEQQGIDPGYAMLSMPDPMAAFGLSAAQATGLRAHASLVDLPISVGVDRYRDRPASGRLPAVLDLASGVCTGGNPNGGGNQEDCGHRGYQAWLGLRTDGGQRVTPSDAGLPPVLAVSGSPARLDRLYRNCTGPLPFPGAIANGLSATVTPGTLPTYEQLRDMSIAWRAEGRAGKKTVVGKVVVARNEPGTLVDATLEWTLTICPLNQDGDAPPGCP